MLTNKHNPEVQTGCKHISGSLLIKLIKKTDQSIVKNEINFWNTSSEIPGNRC